MRTADFHYALPPELIAQRPALRREGSRLLVLHRADGRLEHRQFEDFPGYLRPGDALVLNDSRVIAARLRAWKPASGGAVEVLLVEENGTNDWWAMVKPGKRVRVGTRFAFRARGGVRSPAVSASVLEKNRDGLCRLGFEGVEDIQGALDVLGEVPLPPYIRRDAAPGVEDLERYQTVYARCRGSVAAPTAGLHFTDRLLEVIRAAGVRVCFVTLHVGLGTFAPVKTTEVEAHAMHEEAFDLPRSTAEIVNTARSEGRRVVAVGTTTVRVLESAATPEGEVGSLRGRTRMFIRPPYSFRIVDALLTNFHLPESTLLMLVSAFAAPGGTSGRDTVLAAYAEAVGCRYRFFSYGDAMLVL